MQDQIKLMGTFKHNCRSNVQNLLLIREVYLMKKLIVSLLIISTVFIISACGAATVSDSQGAPNNNVTDEKAILGSGGGTGGEAPTLYDSSSPEGVIDQYNGSFALAQGQKIIFTADITMETKDFDKTITDLKRLVQESKGYIVSSSVNGSKVDENNLRNASFTIKVPQAIFESSKDKIEGLGNVTTSYTQSQDITKQFVDTEARIKTLKVQEERMLALLTKANKMEDIIALESRLSELRLEIESYTGSLNEMEAQTDYGTINVYVSEVKELTSSGNGFMDNLLNAIKGSLKSILIALEGAIIGLIYAAPYIIVVAIIIIVVRRMGLIRNLSLPKRNKKKDNDKDQNNSL